jgi:4-alpha-glucanotransferase
VSPRAGSAASSRRRCAGILLPLFSLRSDGSWGIGEIGDLPPFCRWLAQAEHGLLQLLPILEMSPGERSPYAALSAFAIDPIYVSLDAVAEFRAAGVRPELEEAIEGARRDPRIDYDAVRAVKRRALEVAFTRFMAAEWKARTPRAREFRHFRRAEAGWLDDYALFRACQERHAGRSWTAWETGLRDRKPRALGAARASLVRERLFHEWVQWIAAGQWAAARQGVEAAGVRLKGDLPFMVSVNSADVWARQGEFALDATLGAPPDAFNVQGQEWGLPVCRWEVMARGGFAWLAARAARAGALFHAFRVDHVVGFYRQYVIGPGKRGFVPAEEPAQLALGERLLRRILEDAGGVEVIGEDLGVVPPFVRRSLARLGIPGYRVLRWEADDGAFRDPRNYPARSVTTSGTHDTSPLASWWEEELAPAGRRALAALPAFAALREVGREFTPAVHATLLEGLYGAGSDLVVLPFQDTYGGRERINVPATVGPTNWAYRSPWTTAELAGVAGEPLRDRLRALARRHVRR